MICVNARFLTRPITGAQRYAVEISREMVRIEPAVRLLAPPRVAHPALAQELGAESVGRGSGILWEQLELPRHLRRLGSPLLIGMSFTAPLRYAPTVLTVHDVCFTRREWVSRGFYYYYGFLVPRLCRRAARIVTVSEFSKREITAQLGVPASKIEVVPNAVAPGLLRAAATPCDNPYGDYVLGVATLQRRKNLATLVGAFGRIRHPSVRLVIAGAADPKVYGRQPELAGLLRNPRVHLTGYVDDAALAALYRHARVLCFPSLYEGFGIPPIEAMSLGCPVVTSNTSSLPEVCGDAALYVDPGDEGAIARALERVLGDPALRGELIARGLQRAKSFDWRDSARRFLEVARAV